MRGRKRRRIAKVQMGLARSSVWAGDLSERLEGDGFEPLIRRRVEWPVMAPSVTALAHRAFPELRADRPYHQPADDSRP